MADSAPCTSCSETSKVCNANARAVRAACGSSTSSQRVQRQTAGATAFSDGTEARAEGVATGQRPVREFANRGTERTGAGRAHRAVDADHPKSESFFGPKGAERTRARLLARLGSVAWALASAGVELWMGTAKREMGCVSGRNGLG